MNIEIIAIYNDLDKYIEEALQKPDHCDELWEEYAIVPYWDTICQYAPMDLSERKPKAIKNIEKLKEQITLLQSINLSTLKDEFMNIASSLPNYDDDTMYVAIFPLSDDDISVKEKQNGVLGSCIFGNMLININPLADGYPDWISYVFAHEYHHNVWGNYWFALHGGELENQFIDSLLIDGQADNFALSFYPELKPRWIFDMTEQTENYLWNTYYSNLIMKTDVDYPRFMFGDPEHDIPWCAGYTIGHRIINSFLKENTSIRIQQLLEMRPIEIFEKSGYGS